MAPPRKRSLRALDLEPPPALSPRAADVFRHVVGSVDAEHFRAVDAPLIAQYSIACAQSDEASERLAKEGCVVGGKPSPWLAIQKESMRSAAVLASKLRVCPISRLDRNVAGTTTRRPVLAVDDIDEELLPTARAFLGRS